MQKIEIIGLSKEEINAHFIEIGEKPFRAKQLWQWLYEKGATDFESMSNFSLPLRSKLAEMFTLSRPKIITDQVSTDGTHKWLLEFADGQKVETVYIPEDVRGAVCISTQVGCGVGCTFCHTGSQKLTRNLTSGEILSQFLIVKDAYNEWNNPKEETRKVSNIVVMGMGEPLHNMDNTFKAMKIAIDSDGLAISKRKITLSTSGVVKNIALVAKDLGVKLAISLHAPNDAIRSKIMPINIKQPIADIMKACQDYQSVAGTRFITFEYLMLDGINDSIENAQELSYLIKRYKLGAKFNLIPFNPWPGCSYRPSPKARVQAFAQELEKAGIEAPVRKARGQDILAACGQLKSVKS